MYDIHTNNDIKEYWMQKSFYNDDKYIEFSKFLIFDWVKLESKMSNECWFQKVRFWTLLNFRHFRVLIDWKFFYDLILKISFLTFLKTYDVKKFNHEIIKSLHVVYIIIWQKYINFIDD